VICGLAGHMDIFYSLAFLACCPGLLSLVSYLPKFFLLQDGLVCVSMDEQTDSRTHSALEHSRISWPQIF